ncbi:MAG: hypothetical protein LH624_12225, partial [Cryobacterium sp.]|nr:hypothetical protein [Cryobacterium sp.]
PNGVAIHIRANLIQQRVGAGGQRALCEVASYAGKEVSDLNSMTLQRINALNPRKWHCWEDTHRRSIQFSDDGVNAD